MKRTFFIFLLINAISSFAQDPSVKNLQTEAGKTITKDAADTIPATWKTGGIFSLSLAQGSLRNWAAGGDEFSLSLNAYINGHAFYKKGKHSWDNNLDIYFGYIKTTSLGARKNDDRIDFLSKYGYALSKTLSVAGLCNFRTQLFDGFTYSDTSREFSSAFMSPAYIILSPGLDYHPVSNFSIFFSPIAARWVIIKDNTIAAKGFYGPAGEKSVSEFGAFVTINYTSNLNKTVSYKGRLDLFSNYKNNPENIDVFMENLFAAKLSNVLSATWSLDIIYDDDAKLFGPNQNAPRTQLKSLIGVGLLVKLQK